MSPHCQFVTYRLASARATMSTPTRLPPSGPVPPPVPLSHAAQQQQRMDLLPPATEPSAGGGAGAGWGRRRGVGFRSLKLVTVAMDEALPAEPVGVAYGRLANGLTYYVCSNPKPCMRAALSLAVKVLECYDNHGKEQLDVGFIEHCWRPNPTTAASLPPATPEG